MPNIYSLNDEKSPLLQHEGEIYTEIHTLNFPSPDNFTHPIYSGLDIRTENNYMTPIHQLP